MFAIIIISLLGLCSLDAVELFSAIADLEKVLHSEKDVANNLRNYISKETFRLQELAKIADDLEQHGNVALEDPEKFVSNPVNAFKLVRRFTSEWQSIIDDYVRGKNTEEFINNLPAMTKLFPDEEDLSGAAIALFRLVDTYALDATQVALGNILRVNNSPPLSAKECFELGVLAYSSEDFYHAILFLNASLFILEKEEVQTVSRSSILDYLSYCYYKQGNIQRAHLLILELLQLEPYHERYLAYKTHFQELLKQDNSSPTSNKNKLVRPLDEYKMSAEFFNYEKLCRGEKTMFYADEHKLKCRLRRHHPIFFINPLREEEVYLKPRVIIYHDVVSHGEIELIKHLASPRLNRATVQNSVTGALETAHYRVSKSAWLKDVEHVLISRVSVRSGALMNLSTETVEELQVVNYGIGGHYEPHFDFARKSESNAFDTAIGNRIATFICYLTNVEAGGSTVFPRIGLELRPKLGSCAMWYNLFLNGDGDHDTRHAACPVLVGNKWVANKWFHERGQEFIRKCALEATE